MTSPRSDHVSFRPLAAADFPTMLQWLTDPEVAKWWPEDNLSLATITARYTPIVKGDEPVRGYVMEIGGAEAGYIQAYRVDDHPNYAQQLEVPAGAVASDMFIGQFAWRGQGWGVAVLQAFLRHVVLGEFGTDLALIAPTPANTRAIRPYERCGFRRLKTVAVVDDDNPLDSGDEYVMTLTRDAFGATIVEQDLAAR